MKARATRTLSVVIPVCNEEGNLFFLHDRLTAVFAQLDGWCPVIIFVDDHSSDRSPSILAQLAARDPRVRWLRLSRNSGSHVACAAGLAQCDSDAVILMAADLQDPPEIIPQLLERHAVGDHVVWAVREAREGESLFTRTSSLCFYWLMNRLTSVRLPPRGADVMLADRRAVEAFRQMPERSLSLFSVFAWMGFRQSSIPYVKQARHTGASKWTVHRKLLLAIDSFVGFSYVPLRFMSYLGFLVAGIGGLWGLLILANKLRGSTQAIGYASTMITILTLGGLQMLMLGVVGEYLWRTLEESRRRPQYFIENTSHDQIASDTSRQAPH